MTNIKRSEHSTDIDFSGWNLDYGSLENQIKKDMAKLLADAMDEDGVEFTFLGRSGSPLAMCVSLDFLPASEEEGGIGPSFNFDIETDIIRQIEDGTLSDTNDKEGIEAIVSALRELANRIEREVVI